MVSQNKFEIPTACTDVDCATSSCLDKLVSLTGLVKVVNVDGKLHGYPQLGTQFGSYVTDAITRLAICTERQRLAEATGLET